MLNYTLSGDPLNNEVHAHVEERLLLMYAVQLDTALCHFHSLRFHF